MSEGEVAERMRGGLDTVVSFPAPIHPGPNHPAPSQVSFDRHEQVDRILRANTHLQQTDQIA